jgi:hypothetical protein
MIAGYDCQSSRIFQQVIADFFGVIIGSIENHALNVNSRKPVNIASHQSFPYNLKPFVCNSRKVSATLAPILLSKRRANNQTGEGEL